MVIMWILRTADGIIARVFFRLDFLRSMTTSERWFEVEFRDEGNWSNILRDPRTVSWVGKDGGERFQAVSPVLENFRRRVSRSGWPPLALRGSWISNLRVLQSSKLHGSQSLSQRLQSFWHVTKIKGNEGFEKEIACWFLYCLPVID